MQPNSSGAALLCLLTLGLVGCAMNQTAVVLAPVGPPPAKSIHPMGSLIVATAVEEPNPNPDTNFYPHIGYTIYDSQGAFVRVVRNHVGAWDEQPELVELPPGKYTVVTKGESDENLVIPVTVETATTTSVDLTRHGRSLVRL